MSVRNSTKIFTLFIIIAILFSGLPIAKPQPVGAQQEHQLYLPLISKERPLTVGTLNLSGNFSPFFSESGYDIDVTSMTQISLLTTDRLGMIVNNAIEGETRYHYGNPYTYYGAANTNVAYDPVSDQTTYTATLRSDLKFSDGVPVTIDDVIFTYYTLLDPTYEGPIRLRDYPIIGLREYQTQVTAPVFERYRLMAEQIYDAGMYHSWSPNDPWTQAQQDYFWNQVHQRVLNEVNAIITYCVDRYVDTYAYQILRRSPEEIRANEGLQVAFGMALWGFGEVNDSGTLVALSGRSWNLTTNFPTPIDFRSEIYIMYNNDIKAAFPYESANGTDVFSVVQYDFIRKWGPLDPEMGGQGIPNISGITKVNETTIQVILKGYNTADVYSILGISITPLHYYGDINKYDYGHNKFGFDFEDLSKQLSLISKPLGAGPYTFVSFDQQNGIVTLVANNHYFKGAPLTRVIHFKETSNDGIVSGITNGTLDISEIYYHQTRYSEIRAANSNGQYTGDVITTNMVDNMGYGYMGLNAGTINVAGEPSSTASRNLRKAFATILAVHRNDSIAAYYGEAAKILDYSILPTSWASPQPTDPDYSVAFSVDVQGNPIYTPGMTPDQRYAAARQAALGFFEAAGYSISNGRIVAAPQGAKMSYEIIIPGGGTGNHPAFGSVLAAKSSLQMIGMELKINDPVDANVLWDALDSGQQEIWVAAWGATIDPDLYQIYHSSNIMAGSESNYYQIADPALDTLIMQARMTVDQTQRKALIRQSLEIIRDWGVDIPNYIRHNASIFSTKRIDINSITPLITTFWGWMNDIESLRLK